ncbi:MULTISPECIES: hypothetical protein [unclassified Pseudarthrobacter]|uniref:hypothetical protein n=1 Tax=unclassified Pseudarthrobacter TaxID=2647000 RepID=UPI003078908C
MTEEGQLEFSGLPSDELANEKKPALKRKRVNLVEEPAEVAPTATDPELATDEAEEPADTSSALEHFSEIEESISIGISDESISMEEPAAGIAREQAEEEVEAPDPVAGVGGGVVVVSGARRLFLLTNRMNLIGILSSRVLAPRESFHKYYADLLELSPGWVPLLTVQPTAQLVERVVAERGAGAPVLVELSESGLKGQQPDSPVTYVRAALLSDVVAIHFREEKSLREHRARGYSNVHPHEDLLRVSSELFTSTSDVKFPVGAPEDGAGIDWLQIDRTRGALSGFLAAADSGEGLAVASRALGAPQVPKGTVLPHWLTWDSLTGRVPAPVTESEAELADRLIFQTAYRILGERDQAEYWSASEVLEAVASEIQSAQPNPGAQVLIDRNLQRVRELVNVERDFEPFRNPGSPYVAAKSFLMVLLRPDLGQLLDWSAEETGADPTTRTVAAVLAGRLRGLARESVKLRNKALDDITAAQAVHAATGAERSLGVAEFVASAAGTTLLLNGMELQAAAPLVSIQPPSSVR